MKNKPFDPNDLSLLDMILLDVMDNPSPTESKAMKRRRFMYKWVTPVVLSAIASVITTILVYT